LSQIPPTPDPWGGAGILATHADEGGCASANVAHQMRPRERKHHCKSELRRRKGSVLCNLSAVTDVAPRLRADLAHVRCPEAVVSENPIVSRLQYPFNPTEDNESG